MAKGKNVKSTRQTYLRQGKNKYYVFQPLPRDCGRINRSTSEEIKEKQSSIRYCLLKDSINILKPAVRQWRRISAKWNLLLLHIFVLKDDDMVSSPATA